MAGNVPQPPPPQQPQVPVFALNPAAAIAGNILDFSNKLHRTHYEKAAACLYAESSDHFDLTKAKVLNFLSQLEEQANKMSISVLQVPTQAADF